MAPCGTVLQYMHQQLQYGSSFLLLFSLFMTRLMGTVAADMVAPLHKNLERRLTRPFCDLLQELFCAAMAPFLAYMQAWAYRTGRLPQLHPDWGACSNEDQGLLAMLHPQDAAFQVLPGPACKDFPSSSIWSVIRCLVCLNVLALQYGQS